MAENIRTTILKLKYEAHTKKLTISEYLDKIEGKEFHHKTYMNLQDIIETLEETLEIIDKIDFTKLK